MRNEIRKKLALLLALLTIFMGVPFSSYAVVSGATITNLTGTATGATTGHFDWDFNIDSQYVFDGATATLNSSPQVVDLNSKILSLNGLDPSTMYTLIICAKYKNLDSFDFHVETFKEAIYESMVKDLKVTVYSKQVTANNNTPKYSLGKGGNFMDFPSLKALFESLEPEYNYVSHTVIAERAEDNAGWRETDIGTVTYEKKVVSYVDRFRIVGSDTKYNTYEAAKAAIEAAFNMTNYDSKVVNDDPDFTNNLRKVTIVATKNYVSDPVSASFTTKAHSTYSIIFDTNSGSAIGTIGLVSPTSTFTLPTNPTKPGFSFAGWFTDEALTAAYTGNGVVTYGTPFGGTYSMTLYAKWTPASTYSVIFNTNGGSSIGTIGLVSPTSTFTVPTNPTKPGFSFAGWFTDSELTSAYTGNGVVTYGTPFGGTYSMTLYAKWTPASTYSVIFNTNGGSAIGTIGLVSPTSTFTVPTNPTKPGFSFAGWFTDSELANAYTGNGVVTYGTPFGGTYFMTLYAKWTPASTYSVIFNTNGGNAIGTIGLVSPTDTFTMPTNPTKSGFSFAGWFTDSELANAYTGNGVVTYSMPFGGTYSMTLYAKWTEVQQPTTAPPTTAEPTTAAPTTAEPTTAAPTTAEPTTAASTTAEPTTAAPTSAPTTEEPATEPSTIPTTEGEVEELTEELIPEGAAIIINFDEPLDSSTFEEVIELGTEAIPLAPALPQTGQLPVELFYGIGGLITAAGVFLKKK